MSLALLLRPRNSEAPATDPSPLTFTYWDRGHTFTAREGRRVTTRLLYKKTADRPAASGWIVDDDGTLIDLSSATFSLKIGLPGSAALLTKTTNIAGAAGSGTEPDGTPNIVITWAAGDLNLTPGTYVWELTVTENSLDRVFFGDIRIVDVIT